MTIARVLNVSPLEVFKHDADEVIMLVNYCLEKSDKTPTKTNTPAPVKTKDSFWDF